MPLELGWAVVQLFGCSTNGSPTDEGLAVHLAGRRPVLLDASSAILAGGRDNSACSTFGLDRERCCFGIYEHF
jgi:hypothetical protein